MDGVGVEGGDHRKVVTTTVRAKNNFEAESKYGLCDAEIDGGEFTGGWVSSCA
jgi:hypothetical protein